MTDKERSDIGIAALGDIRNFHPGPPKRGARSEPVCGSCDKSGAGVLFSMSSPHGFGKYCVPCEKLWGDALS